MIAKALFTKNFDEIREAERLDLPVPDPVHTFDTFGFYLKDVKRFHKTTEGNINIIFENDSWSIKYTDELWSRLLKMFEE
jgi:hypothetical protein